MKAVFLDFATVASDELDVAPLARITDEFTVYDNTPANLVASRIKGCEFVYLNKVRMTNEIIGGSSTLKLIGLIATGVDNIDLQAALANFVH